MKKIFIISIVVLFIALTVTLITINLGPTAANLTDNAKNYDFFGDHHKFATYLLHQVHDNASCLIDHLNKKYGSTSNIRIREGLYRLTDRYHINKLIENVPNMFSSDTSYTINKGEIIAICLRHKNQINKFHDMNLITFVTVHELAHIFSVGYGHDDNFWESFKFLLREAIICGIYEKEDYTNSPKHYCGMTITYQPLLDNTVQNID